MTELHDVPWTGFTSSSQVFAVTVTYGQRAELLTPVLEALLEQPVARVIVVNNGASWDVKALADTLAPDRIEVVELGANQGSAAGFAAGIDRAYASGAEFIWLLDDDNRPGPETLGNLLAARACLRRQLSDDSLAVLAFRPDHQADVAAGVPLRYINPRPSSFWGFHVVDIPYKIWRRMPWGRPRLRDGLPATVRLDVAPYSGLLFHRALIERLGLPRTDFVLYADDTEFTYRITANGGAIYLITGAPLTDMETSWNTKGRFSSTLEGWLKGVGDLRAFYGARNGTYVDRYCRATNRLMFAINRSIYCLALRTAALLLRRTARYGLLRQAIRDGLTAHLGVHPRYPL